MMYRTCCPPLMRRLLLVPLAMLALLMATPSAHATNGIFSTWKSKYPTSTSDDNVVTGTGTGCALCHVSSSGGGNYNAYGYKLRELIQAGNTSTNAITLAATFNSDADPTASNNLDEISANSQPGWTKGATNTTYNNSGTPTPGQNPPAIAGDLNPVWVDLGLALPGTSGTPKLAGTGTLVANTALTLTLTSALPNAPAFFIVGFANLNAPFKGGTLVPSVTLSVALTTGPTGQIVLPATWPAAVPAGFPIYLQYWIKDAGGAKGFSSSNGLKAIAN